MSYKIGTKTLGLWEQTICEIRSEIKELIEILRNAFANAEVV